MTLTWVTFNPITLTFDLSRQATDHGEYANVSDGDLGTADCPQLDFAGQAHGDVAVNRDDDHRPDTDHVSKQAS